MRIRTRIIILLITLFLGLCAAVYSTARYLQYQRTQLLLQKEKEDKQALFGQILKLVNVSLENLATDYTYWDDMVNFVSTADPVWSRENIDASLSVYKINAAWVYNLDEALVYAVDNIDDFNFRELPGAEVSLKHIFSENRFCHFFAVTSAGVMEIRGGTIHHTNDPDRKLSPNGYFLTGKVWDAEFLRQLSELIGSKVFLSIVGQDSALDRQILPGQESFSTFLNGADGNPVARITVIIGADPGKSGPVILQEMLTLFVLFAIPLVVIAIALVVWISVPLNVISTALSEEKPQNLKTLQKDNSELGELARLIIKYFEQRNDLLKEIADREVAEENLKKAYDELKSVQRQLIQAEKMSSIGQLAAGVAHEINNPVGFISGNMDVLARYVDDYKTLLRMLDRLKQDIRHKRWDEAGRVVEEMAEFENQIDLDYVIKDADVLLEQNRKGIERVRRIVSDLRAFSRVDSREEAEQMESVKIEDVIDGILDMVHSEMKYKAELRKSYGDTPRVKCSVQRVGQVFINLFVNATHAIENRGVIEVRTYSENGFVCVDVSDTGKGIKDSDLKKVFDPFFTTKPVGQGTGLGLSVSYEIIKKHGGDIKVRSQVGKGTVFTVSLPAV